MAQCPIWRCGLESGICLGRCVPVICNGQCLKSVCCVQSKTQTRLIHIVFIDHKSFS